MTPSEFAGISLGLGVVRGVRSFDVDTHGRLMGVNYKVAWKPGENEAKCLLDPYSTAIRGVANAIYTFSLAGGGGFTIPKVTGPAIEKSKPSEEAPHSLDKCSCGFYAYYDGSNDYKSDARISAVVEGYGETLIGTRGFRASKARIVALCIPGRRRSWPAAGWFAGHAGAASVIGPAALVLFIFCMLMQIARLATFGHMDLTQGLLALGAIVGGLVASTAIRGSFFDGPTASNLDTGQIAKVRRNYPDVPVFTSFKAMVAAFPPDKGLEPSPDSDPKFWER